MAKFCTECGKELKDGQTCDCKKGKEKKKVNGNSHNSFDFQEAFVTIWDTTKKMFRNPISTLKEFSTEKNVYIGFIIIALVALINGIGGLLTVNNIMGSLPFNGFEVFIKFFIMSLIPTASTILVYYIVYNSILKSKVTWKTLVSAISGTMILQTIGSVLSIICGYISGWLAAIILIFTLAIYVIQFVTIVRHVTDIDEEKNAWAFALCMTISLVISGLILGNIISDMLMGFVNNSFYGGFFG